MRRLCSQSCDFSFEWLERRGDGFGTWPFQGTHVPSWPLAKKSSLTSLAKCSLSPPTSQRGNILHFKDVFGFVPQLAEFRKARNDSFPTCFNNRCPINICGTDYISWINSCVACKVTELAIWLWISRRQRSCLLNFWLPRIEKKPIGWRNNLVSEWRMNDYNLTRSPACGSFPSVFYKT